MERPSAILPTALVAFVIVACAQEPAPLRRAPTIPLPRFLRPNWIACIWQRRTAGIRKRTSACIRRRRDFITAESKPASSPRPAW